jgi:RNA polymerase sigma-70 factor (ECF subfamily)
VETSISWLGRLAGEATDADWRQLVDVYGPLLSVWLARLGVPASDRDDLIQEVLMAVVQQVSEFDYRGPGAFRAWLRGIVANQARKFFRQRPTGPNLDLDQIATEDSVLGRQWDREHDEHLVARALRLVESDFTPATWQAFRRQVIDGKAPTVVAIELGLSLNAVIIAKSRVLKRLRAELCGLIE